MFLISWIMKSVTWTAKRATNVLVIDKMYHLEGNTSGIVDNHSIDQQIGNGLMWDHKQLRVNTVAL